MKKLKLLRGVKGFTLVELLVVVGILGVLAVTALVALNPVEAQRKARDSARLGDLQNLIGIMDQYMGDNAGLNLPATATSTSSTSANCSTGWLSGSGADFCNFTQKIPQGPTFASTTLSNIISAAGARSPANQRGGYGFTYTAATGTYEFCTFLEARDNFARLSQDGGNAPLQYEVGSGIGGVCTP